MAGEDTGASAQAMWDEVNKEREAGLPPSEAPKDETPPVIEEVKEAAPAAAAETPEAPAIVDPYEGLSDALKARLAGFEKLQEAVAVIPQLQQALNTANGRVAAMQREHDQAKNAAKAVQDAPSSAQIKAASGDTHKWESLKVDFPDWAEATEQFVQASLAGLKPPSTVQKAEVEQLVQSVANQSEAKLTRAIEEAKLEGKYENWLTEINTPEFVQWLGAQPPEVKTLAGSTKGRDAIKLLDAYHAAPTAQTPEAAIQARASKLAAAVTTRPTSAAPTGKTVEQMDATELWEYERKRAAKRQGTYGLSY